MRAWLIGPGALLLGCSAPPKLAVIPTQSVERVALQSVGVDPDELDVISWGFEGIDVVTGPPGQPPMRFRDAVVRGATVEHHVMNLSVGFQSTDPTPQTAYALLRVLVAVATAYGYQAPELPASAAAMAEAKERYLHVSWPIYVGNARDAAVGGFGYNCFEGKWRGCLVTLALGGPMFHGLDWQGEQPQFAPRW